MSVHLQRDLKSFPNHVSFKLYVSQVLDLFQLMNKFI